MRSPNNGRRMRGRQNRRPSQPMRNTVYDSNGPEVRVRGNAGQICEKYLALARDAQSAGDMVKMEACYQFAEHYQRILNSLKNERDNSANNQRNNNRDNNDGNRNNNRQNNNRNDQNNNSNAVATNETNGSGDAPAEVIEKTPVQNPASANGGENEAPVVSAPTTVDLSETDQPSINMEMESITAAAKPARAPRKPRRNNQDDDGDKSAPKPRARTRRPASTQAEGDSAPEATKDGSGKDEGTPFGDSPLPGFLSGGK